MASTDPCPADACRYAAAVAFLNERIDFERSLAVPYHDRQFKLERMRELLARLGDPQHGLPIVHIAGTKGKGSTAAMLAAVLTAAGYRTGLFTSPHLETVEERLAIDGVPCHPAELASLIERVRPAVAAMDEVAAHREPPETGPTFFEIITAAALLHFAEVRADWVVLEVGLGGRLDSTNVCQPCLSVVTSISFDHTKQLGDTLEAIAAEKAGIIKPGVPVVSGVSQPGPREVIRQAACQRGSPIVELDGDFHFHYTPPHDLERTAEPGRIEFQYRAGNVSHTLRDVRLGLVGQHQGANAAVALATLVLLQEQGWKIPEEAIRQGLASVVWPARVEVIARRPTIVIDAAHNLASIHALIIALDESFTAWRRILVFATTQEKDIRAMVVAAAGRFGEVILTQYLDNPRAVPVEDLHAIAREAVPRQYRVCPTPAEAWDVARTLASPDDLICVTGSFFIAAQMRHEIQARPLGEPVG